MNRFAKKGAAQPVLLVVSFGTSYNDNRDLSIGAVERALGQAYPQYEIRRAFTSQVILDILRERDHLQIDNVHQAMERLVADGVEAVVIQPTHVMTGLEYDDVIREIRGYRHRFRSMKVGRPLLVEDRDYDILIQALAEETRQYNQPDTAIVFMGHGTEHAANATYPKLQQKLLDAGYGNFFIGTVEASPTAADVLAQVQKTDAKKVVLLPLMVVAGDHAHNDMAGDEADTWNSMFTAAGYRTQCILKGLGQYPAVQKMFVDHVSDALSDGQLPGGERTRREEGEILPQALAEGTYSISVTSSSAMFQVISCTLEVSKGAMTAHMILSGDGYGKLYPGTAQEAAQAEKAILPTTDPQGRKVYALDVPALNRPIPCAAWSLRRQCWYDRMLVFHSAASR